TDASVIARHFAEAEEAHIDVFACPWRGPGSFEDRAVRKLLAAEGQERPRICLVLEPCWSLRDSRSLGRDLVAWLREGMAAATYFTIDGRPVLLITAAARHQRTAQEWADALAEIERTAAPGVLAVSMGTGDADGAVFDGLAPPEAAPPAGPVGSLDAHASASR